MRSSTEIKYGACRTCLSEPGLNYIFEDQGLSLTIRDLLGVINVQLQQSDDLPKGICDECFHFLKQVHVFKLQCDIVQNKLLEVNSVIKMSPSIREDIQHTDTTEALSCDRLLNIKSNHQNIEAVFIKESSCSEVIHKNVNNDLQRNSHGKEKHHSSKPCLSKEDSNRSSELHTNVLAENEQSYDKLVMEEEYCNDPLKTEIIDTAGLLHLHTSEKSTNTTQCPECNKICLNGNHIRRHMLVQHNKDCVDSRLFKNVIRSDPDTHRCTKCNRQFIFASYLRDHLLSHSGDETYKCTECNECYNVARDLNKHLLTHSGVGVHKCPQCDKEFMFANYLENNLLTHRNESAMHKCTFCECVFSTGDVLIQHMSEHRGTKLYKCQQCNKGFEKRYVLQRHMLTHSVIKSHKCTVCGQAYSHAGDLKRHVQTHKATHKHKCPHCVKTYPFASYLRDHILTHTGIRAHTCSQCDKSFKLAQTLRRHVLLHAE